MDLVHKYRVYTAHARRTVYCDPSVWKKERAQVEEAWPEYRDSLLMLSRPNYQSDRTLSANDWRRQYLNVDVEALQKRKQHHVHLAKTPDGPRLPLTHCQDRKDKTKCKAGFPRDKQLTEETLLVCQGLARQMDMPVKGKRSMLGSLWGPVNDACGAACCPSLQLRPAAALSIPGQCRHSQRQLPRRDMSGRQPAGPSLGPRSTDKPSCPGRVRLRLCQQTPAHCHAGDPGVEQGQQGHGGGAKGQARRLRGLPCGKSPHHRLLRQGLLSRSRGMQ